MARHFFSIVFVFCSCGLLHAQADSPVGRWILKEHVIRVWQGGNLYIDTNVFHNQFSSVLTFDSSGTFVHEIYNQKFHGTWRQSIDRTKFAMRYKDGRKLIQKYARWHGHNFELPFIIREELPDLYPAPPVDHFRGESAYVRMDNSAPAEISKAVIGKWRMCTQLDKNPDEDCSMNAHAEYTFHEDGTYTDGRSYISMGKTYFYHGTWKMINSSVLIIDIADENNMSSPPTQLNITWATDSLFYTKGREGRREHMGQIVYTYFKKI